LYVTNVSWKSTTSPRGAVAGGRRRVNQSVNVCSARAGSGRRRSMPTTFSISQRLNGTDVIQLAMVGSRDMTRFSRSIRPKRRLRSGSPWAW
jgi:hypothetical protein